MGWGSGGVHGGHGGASSSAWDVHVDAVTQEQFLVNRSTREVRHVVVSQQVRNARIKM